VKKYYGKNKEGSFILSIYDPSYPSKNNYIYVNKDYNTITISNYKGIRDFEMLTDFNIYKHIDID
jgi:hypothetical protein